MWNEGQTSFDDSFKFKTINDWTGNDCFNFANVILDGLCIPHGVWLNKDAFQFMIGKDILTYKEKDYFNILGEEYGGKFFHAVKKYLKHIKGKSKTKYSNSVMPVGSSYESNNWTVPQSQLSVDDIYTCRSLSPLMYSSTPDYNMSSSHGEAPLNTYQSFNGSNYLTEIQSLDSLGEFEESIGYSVTDSFSSGSDMIETSNYSDPRYNISDQYDDESCLIGACGYSGVSYPDDQYPCDSAYFDSAIDAGPSSFLDDDLYLGFENMMDQINIDSINIGDQEQSEFDIYIPNQNPIIQETNPQRNMSSNSAEVAIAPSIDGNSKMQEKKFLKKIVTGKRKNRTRNPKSWEFLVRLLIDPQTNPSLIKWEDKEKGTFRLVNKDEIARLWGSRTSKHKDEPLSYENFARILRYHYKNSGMLKAVSEKHLVYQLGDPVIKNLKQNNFL